MFLGTATLSTLQVRVASGAHLLKEIILQGRCTTFSAQGLPFAVRNGSPVASSTAAGMPTLFAHADLHNGFFVLAHQGFVLARFVHRISFSTTGI
jgi:hypothetical protein